MKYVLIVFASLLLGLNNSNAQNVNDIEKITFKTSKRNGEVKKLEFSPKRVVLTIENNKEGERSNQSRKLSKRKFKRILRNLEKVELTSIPSLQSPTNKRAFDGADHSIISISLKDNHVYKHRFDDLNPHISLKALLDSMLGHSKRLSE